MMYVVKFTGRRVGAIGITYQTEATLEVHGPDGFEHDKDTLLKRVHVAVYDAGWEHVSVHGYHAAANRLPAVSGKVEA